MSAFKPSTTLVNAPTPPERIPVAIGVVTYRRPPELQRLLNSLRELDPLEAGSQLVAIVVVDNDPDGTGRAAVEGERSRSEVPIRYSIEPTPGIAAARNAVVAAASDCRLLAFIDDDEVASPGWLRQLVDLQIRSGAELIAGPTVSVLPEDVPKWLADGRLYARPRRPTGSTFRYAGSGNLLLDLEGVGDLSPLFDLRYGLLGGSDTHLFMRARSAGLGMLWCDEAVVSESVPVSRTRLTWILKRAFRVGNTVGLCERESPAGPGRISLLTARCLKALIRIGQGAGEVVLGVARLDRAAMVAGLQRVLNAAGMVAGALGFHYAEYRRKPDGRHPNVPTTNTTSIGETS